MILANLVKAIREQNYYAVFLEFVIVIAGVVIGFQVTAWNEARADRAAERNYLVRLHHDMERSICPLQFDLLLITGWNEQARQTLDALLTKEPDAVAGNGVELVVATRIRTVSLFRATLNELVNGGQMHMIADPALRARIADTDAQFNQLNEMIDILIAAQPGYVGQVQNRLRPVVGADGDTVTYDFDALAEDEEFLNALGHALRYTRFNRIWISEMIGVADELRIELAEEIGADTGEIVCDKATS